ncbi:MAG TPA: serine/threonine-protein kinase [Nannocystaceae bacterium]|nr:serine/threonine-protein kinase [Nannocystaceae bacterium]
MSGDADEIETPRAASTALAGRAGLPSTALVADAPVDWSLELHGAIELDPLAVVADEVLARFADGAARPHEVGRLGAFADALARGEPGPALEPELRALSHAGFLRGAMVTMAVALRKSPRSDIALMLARELLDAIDPELGVRLLHALLAQPSGSGGAGELAQRFQRGSVQASADLLLGEHLLEHGDPSAALRHFEAVLAGDIDHHRALRGWQQATRALERRGAVPQQSGRGLTLLDGLAEIELAQAFGLRRYELGRPLGRGRHAVVYQAYDRRVGRDVALKRLLDADPRSPGPSTRVLQARFFDEARTLAQVRSPYVVALLDVQPRHRLIALELCKGGNLRLAMRRGLVGPGDVPRIFHELRAALDAVHAAGAVHRDVKPANILVRTPFRGSSVALADFGLAAGPGPKSAGANAGTLRYLAPELRRGSAAATASSDRFSAAVVLLELALLPAPLPDIFDRLDDDLDAEHAVPDDLPAPWGSKLRALLSRDPDARTW